ncbi:hypothetical protein BS50DRAFT_677124 [Corynespora cassiicola Philippines]|uniref:Ricin B lectin domain-containing protein n=1 Tax=Corynespora cassiicola Philippines TaxID=1448308 RepID=A0A2T2NJY7_CORCC|nr:hypothetical protein BS50DRAFT_677124 [Corynespora cassiicola Philippines]
MSDWIGANVYRIENYKDRKAAVAFSGGDRKDGTPCLIWNNDPNKNDRFMFVYLGIGSSGRDEYHIINRKSGTYMSCGEGAKQEKLYGNTLSPWLNRVRWNVIPTRNGTGTYWITPAANKEMKLVTEGEVLSNGTALQIWKGPNSSKGCWWYLRLDDDAILQCPDIGRATAP